MDGTKPGIKAGRGSKGDTVLTESDPARLHPVNLTRKEARTEHGQRYNTMKSYNELNTASGYYFGIDTQAIAENIYREAADMDKDDYSETKEQDIAQIEIALYTLKTQADNGHNPEAAALIAALANIYG